MPHNTDSIAASKAWNKFKSGYMNRKQHKGKPITAEQNLAEYNRERNEFYYDTQRKKLRLIPTDDGEVQDRSGIKKYQLAPLDRRSPLNQNGDKHVRMYSEAGEQGRDMGRFLADGSYDMTPGVSEEEAKKTRDKFDATYMKGSDMGKFQPHADSEWENATYQLMNEGVISESNDQAYPEIQARVERNRGNR